ncbi:isoleucine patch superfamily enzyme, carbonic anhydrase/acetyltransferase [Candidatus Nitrososphaera evergladensis SR1]|uniref:Isoleucine patch superfamily enzyme, carbonic anhydrase/acetyltransferase n=1 Tax=Candidatus Nitrososphaera evergladensis SR1 TaxID=1459636 RepID=A0A075MNC6_9ARCH|nr:carbonic anhydrase [Candidatus Nitrososphaera evergladensis]AIF82660.1 isoleucine patch superfamily enzyme, carbonic anhydrase/acetyltransferase [Candidatus Nitrososphaera evergladensis SR1]
MKYANIASTIAAIGAILALALVLVQPSQQQQQQQTAATGLLRTRPWPPNVHTNVRTDFNPQASTPQISDSAFIHPYAIVIGDCHIGKMVMVAPTAVCRGDEGTPIHVGDYSNMQDGVVIHALETTENGTNIDGRRFSQEGERLQAANNDTFSKGYAVWVGDRTSLAHGAMIHGPAWIGNDTFVGMEAMIFNAKIGNNVAVGVSSTITGGVVIPDGKFVPPGSVITTQEQADSLPSRIGSPYENTNKAVIHVNENLAEGYDELELEKLAHQREAQMEEGMVETGNNNSSDAS